MTPIAFDFETALFAPAKLAPEPACMTWQERGGRAQICGAEDARVHLSEWLEDPSILFVGANVSYDFAVVSEAYPELRNAVFRAYQQDRVTDVQTRQRLLDIAGGVYRGRIVGNGVWIPHRYDLASLAKRCAGMVLQKDEWRLSYGEFIGIPLKDWHEHAILLQVRAKETLAELEAEWADTKPKDVPRADKKRMEGLREMVAGSPERCTEYPLEDAIATLAVFEKQEAHVAYLDDQFRQTRAYFALHLSSAWGLRTDAEGVAVLERETQALYDSVKERLLECELVRPDGTRDTKTAKRLMVDVCNAEGLTLRRTDSHDEEGKDTCCKLDGTKVPKGDPSCEDHVSLDEQACQDAGDERLQDYAEFSTLTKVLKNDVKALSGGIIYPIHTSYGLADTGRTTSGRQSEDSGLRAYSANIQNLRRLPGIREAFIPREGNAFVSCDYPQLESYTWAQYCLAKLGRSKLAEALNAGQDNHLMLAATIANKSYAEAEELYKGGDPEIDALRQLSKCFHPDVEVLTREGWKKISELSGKEDIATPSLNEDGRAFDLMWKKPLRLTHRLSADLVCLKNEGINLRVTSDHRMFGWKRTVHRDGRVTDRAASILATDIRSVRTWPNAGKCSEGGWAPDERVLRLAVATQADGSYSGRQIKLGFTKERKIKRLRSLLEEGEYSFTLSGAKKVPSFTLRPELSEKIKALLSNKCFDWRWLSLTPSLRDVVLEEAAHWDSTVGPKWKMFSYCTTIKQNADVLQAIAHLSGRKTRMTREERQNPNHAEAYKLSVKTSDRSRSETVSIETLSYGGMVYCLTTETDFVLVRDGGTPVITHQCGNYGFPGGMGAKTMLENTIKQLRKDVVVRLKLDLARMKRLKEEWQETWPEARAYLQHVKNMGPAYPERFQATVVSLFTNRFRGGATYCAACNNAFQALGSDCAKQAAWNIARAQYVTPTSALYNTRTVAFIHDEFVLESPLAHVHDVGEALADAMESGANALLPDVPIPRAKLVPVAMLRWSKKAKTVYGADGRLRPWEPKE